jgi:hypothetical protein
MRVKVRFVSPDFYYLFLFLNSKENYFFNTTKNNDFLRDAINETHY